MGWGVWVGVYGVGVWEWVYGVTGYEMGRPSISSFTPPLQTRLIRPNLTSKWTYYQFFSNGRYYRGHVSPFFRIFCWNVDTTEATFRLFLEHLVEISILHRLLLVKFELNFTIGSLSSIVILDQSSHKLPKGACVVSKIQPNLLKKDETWPL